jgi:uncharacterized membrane protein
LEGLLILLGLAAILGPAIVAIVALVKASGLHARIARLELGLESLRGEIAGLRRAARAAAPEPEPAPVASAAPEPVQPEPAPAPSLAEETAAAAEPAVSSTWERAKARSARPPEGDMEQALASRWFVWIGGAAIAIGGLLFVKYAYDNGLISPWLQIVLGLVLGGALVAAGEYVRRRAAPDAGTDYVPAALSAAGVAILFASIYAAYALYELIGSNSAFGGLALAALGALALSRLQGPLIAALGLIGSYAVPALIPSEQPSAWGFFPYLLVILLAAFAVLRGRNWWWLGYAAVAGSAWWTGLWLWGPFAMGDTLPVGLFAHALGLVAVFGILDRRILDDDSGTLLRPKTITAPLAIALAGLAAEAILLIALVYTTSHGSLALFLFYAAAAGQLALAWRKAGLAPLAPVAALLSLFAVMVWDRVALHEWVMDERGLWSTQLGAEAGRFLTHVLAAAVVFTAVGCLGTRRKEDPFCWALTGAGAAVLMVAGAWARVSDLLGEAAWAAIAALFAAGLLSAVWLDRARRDEPGRDLAFGLLSVGSALLLLFGLDRLFDGVWYTLAIAGLALAFAALAAQMRVALQGPIAAALGSLAAIRLFVSRELWLEEQTLPLGAHWPLYGYGVPAVIFLAASRILKAAGYVRSAVTLEGLSLGLVLSLAALEMRVLITGEIAIEEPQLLETAAHILTWLGAAYGLLHRQQFYSSFIATWGARLSIAAAVLAIVFLSLLALNPVVTEEPVPGNVVFNAILLAYLAPVLLIGLIARKLAGVGWEKLRPAAGLLALVLVFAYVTLETKRVFQGRLMQIESLSVAESYAYSAVWLALALALFVAGLRLSHKQVRYAGLGVMLIVVLKVFLLDTAGLEGLYRIASYIGLGFCLVGIGWLYQRFVQKPQRLAEDSPSP